MLCMVVIATKCMSRSPSHSFPTLYYTPGFKLITSGNPFKLFIKMKENGDSSLVVKTVLTREVFFFSNGLKIKRKGNSK